MEIRVADVADQMEIVALYERSQDATALPDPILVPRDELGQRLYARPALERYIATNVSRIVGHALIQPPNPEHSKIWRQALDSLDSPLIEMGGAFVEPELSRQGIWASLSLHRIDAIYKQQAIPVTAAWSVNEHVKRTFQKFGGVRAGRQNTRLGDVDLFVF